MNYKTRAVVDQTFFWIEILHRLDSVIWEKSDVTLGMSREDPDRETGMTCSEKAIWWKNGSRKGLVIRKRSQNAPHLWREHMWNTRWASELFISDQLKEKIEAEKNLSSSGFYARS